MFTFKNIKQKVGGNTKLDTTPVAPSDASGSISQVDPSVKTPAKVQASDNFSTKDYLTRNTMNYDQGDLGDTYTKEQGRMASDSTRLKDKETQSFGDSVAKAKVTDLPTNTYGGAIEAKKVNKEFDILDDYKASMDTYEYAMPDSPNFDAYNQAMQDLSQNQNLAGKYQAGTDNIGAQQTQNVYDKVANKEGRAGMLRDKFGNDVNAYTQGMLSLDSALAERSGFDNRGLQQLSGQTAKLRENENQAINQTRNQNLEAQRAMLEQLAGRGNEISGQRESTLNQFNRDLMDFQTNEQRRLMDESEFVSKTRAGELDRRTEVKRQEDLAKQEAIEEARRQNEIAWQAEVKQIEQERIARDEANRKADQEQRAKEAAEAKASAASAAAASASQLAAIDASNKATLAEIAKRQTVNTIKDNTNAGIIGSGLAGDDGLDISGAKQSILGYMDKGGQSLENVYKMLANENITPTERASLKKAYEEIKKAWGLK